MSNRYALHRVMIASGLLLGAAVSAQGGFGDLDPASSRGEAARTCLRVMQKESARYARTLATLREKCTKPIVQGKGGALADCAPLPAELEAKRLRARDRLELKIARACGGANRACAATDLGADGDVALGDVNWDVGACPALHATTCAGSPIADCSDVADCLACQIEATIEATLGDLAVGRFEPAIFGASTEPERSANRCQRAVVKETRKFVVAKSKILSKCWDAKLKGVDGFDPASPCPTADTSGRTNAMIATLERKLGGRLCKACGGGDADRDGRCDGSPTDLGFLTASFACPGRTTVPPGVAHPYPEVCSAIGSGTTGEILDLQEYVDCVTCAAEAGADCLGFLANGDDDALALDYPDACTRVVPATCGNGALDAGEACDASAAPPDDGCPADTPCSSACTCACPARFEIVADPDDPVTRIDAGWKGFAHDGPFLSDATVTLDVTACDDGDGPDLARDPTCGVCSLAGPVPNDEAGAGDLPSRRCTDDTSVACETDADCVGSGACAFFAGAPLPFTLPLVACGCTIGGCFCWTSLGTCVLNHFSDAMTGTIDVEGGAMALAASVTSRVFAPVDEEVPCPKCAGDVTANDGAQDGTCTAGPRAGLPCDVHGTSPIAGFGSTSFDCPVEPALPISTHTSRLDLATAGQTLTLSAASPACTANGASTLRCACDTCSDAAATPCKTDADCGPGDTCGGLRCLGGAVHGTNCTMRGIDDPVCAGQPCATIGDGTSPNRCGDQICTPIGGGHGECVAGPYDGVCEPSEPFRFCLADSDCPVPGDVCTFEPAPCFPDSGLIGGTIPAEGAADPLIGDVASPILAGVSCPSDPVGYGALALGLPGPMRVTLRSLVVGIQGP